MSIMFILGLTALAIGILIVGALAAMSFGNISALAEPTIHSTQTTIGKTMPANATSSNATSTMKRNSTSMPTPVGPPGP